MNKYFIFFFLLIVASPAWAIYSCAWGSQDTMAPFAEQKNPRYPYKDEWTNVDYIKSCLERLNWNVTNLEINLGPKFQLDGKNNYAKRMFYSFSDDALSGSNFSFIDPGTNHRISCTLKYFERGWGRAQLTIDNTCSSRSLPPTRSAARNNSLFRDNTKADLHRVKGQSRKATARQ